MKFSKIKSAAVLLYLAISLDQASIHASDVACDMPSSGSSRPQQPVGNAVEILGHASLTYKAPAKISTSAPTHYARNKGMVQPGGILKARVFLDVTFGGQTDHVSIVPGVANPYGLSIQSMDHSKATLLTSTGETITVRYLDEAMPFRGPGAGPEVQVAADQDKDSKISADREAELKALADSVEGLNLINQTIVDVVNTDPTLGQITTEQFEKAQRKIIKDLEKINELAPDMYEWIARSKDGLKDFVKERVELVVDGGDELKTDDLGNHMKSQVQRKKMSLLFKKAFAGQNFSFDDSVFGFDKNYTPIEP